MTSAEEYRNKLNEIAQNIKEEPEMRKMREDLSEGIKTAGDLSVDAYEVMNSILDETFDNAKLSSQFESLLQTEIDNLQPNWTQFQENTNRQLAQKTQEISTKASKIELNSLGRIQLTDALVSVSELQAKYPNGKEGLVLVTNDGYTYRYDGTNWVRAVQFQSDGIGDDSVTVPKIEGAEYTNLFDPNTSKPDTLVVSVDGEEVTSANSIHYVLSDYIPVNPGQRLKFAWASNIFYVMFDQNKNGIKVAENLGDTSIPNYEMTIPSDVYFLRLNIKKPVSAGFPNLTINDYYVHELNDKGVAKASLAWLDLSDNYNRKKYLSRSNTALIPISTNDISMSGSDVVGMGIPEYESEIGIDIINAQFLRLQDILFKDFSGGVGLSVANTVGTHSTLNASLLVFLKNNIGFESKNRGEYVTISSSQFNQNEVGARIRGGNVTLDNCMICDNVNGIEILSGDNDSHGIITGCHVNHNTGIALLVDGIANGETITDTHFYDATIHIKNVMNKPVRFNNCVIAGKLILENNVKVIFDNCFFPQGYGLLESVITNSPIEGSGNEVEETGMNSIFNTR